jgi:hypothetical protein
VPFVAFVESREPFEDEGDARREPWLVTALGLVLPWPALVVWLLVASRFADGWLGAGLAYAAVLISAWRALRALPAEGLDQVRQ